MNVRLPASLAASGRYEDFAKGPGAKFGRSNSLKWPWLYDKLVAKGYDHSTAAAISNSRIGVRKNGRLNVLQAKQAHDPKVLKRIAADDKKGKHSTRKSLTSAGCHSAACAPPPAGVGGSKGSGSSKGSVGETSGHAFPIITAKEARGDSRPVSHEEFQRLAGIGQKQLDKFADQWSPITGLDQNWGSVKKEAFNEVQKSWGGATFDAHHGTTLPQGADVYAITVKSNATSTVSVHEKASRAEFDKAMDTALAEFRPILEQASHHLGVFHDDEHHRIDIDPVLIVKNRADVDTIGAASRSIGGAYNFKDGNGYWPPHVKD